MIKISHELEEYFKKIGGRPTKLTFELAKKIEEAAGIDASVAEICYHCEISETTYYRWMKEFPIFADRIKQLREYPVLKARREVVKGIDNNPNFAFGYLKSKRSDEFLEGKSKIEAEIPQSTGQNPEVEALTDDYNKNLKLALAKKYKDEHSQPKTSDIQSNTPNKS